ncbi:hypothetical protein [Nitratifractor sp.]
MRRFFPVFLMLTMEISALFAGGESLSDLLAREESLYQSISRHYMQKREFSEELSSIHRLNSRLQTMRTSDEIHNLLAYLGLCEEELREILAKPHTLQNAESVRDLFLSVAEGRTQILRMSRHRLTMSD